MWLIPLDQLNHKPLHEAKDFLDSVLPELEEAAKGFGGASRPESSVEEALEKMRRVAHRQQIEDYTVRIVVAAQPKESYTVRQWWDSLKAAGLEMGDGNLFWAYDGEGVEKFCAEPYSKLGYFHPGDLEGSVTFPDVALHFMLREHEQPEAVLLLDSLPPWP